MIIAQLLAEERYMRYILEILARIYMCCFLASSFPFTNDMIGSKLLTDGMWRVFMYMQIPKKPMYGGK